MLWVYDHYNSFNSFSAGTVFRRQNLTSTFSVPGLAGVQTLAQHLLVVYPPGLHRTGADSEL